MAANNVTIYNFLAWIREQIEPDRLSALITGYNYTDDSDETIIRAAETYPSFAEDLGKLLGESIKANQAELNRSVGGVSFESTSLSLKDWKKILKRGLSRATGEEYNDYDAYWDLDQEVIAYNSDSKSSKSGKNPEWVEVALKFADLGMSYLFGRETKTVEDSSAKDQSTNGSSTALWIIIGVVVIAIVAILWLSLSKK